MNRLTITAEVNKHLGDRGYGLPEEIFNFPIFNVVVRFCHRVNDQQSSRSIVVNMDARHRGDDDELRSELLQSATFWREFDVSADDPHGVDPGDEWVIETIDRDGVLKWLGIDFQTFKKYQQNDQPVRLPAPRPE